MLRKVVQHHLKQKQAVQHFQQMMRKAVQHYLQGMSGVPHHLKAKHAVQHCRGFVVAKGGFAALPDAYE